MEMSQIWTGLAWLVGINTVLTVILLLFMTKYPKYIMYAYNAFTRIKHGIVKKKIKGSKNTFSYLEYGATTAPTLLLVHGFSSSKESFFGVFKHISRKFHVLAVDLPGHGETPLKDTDIGILHFVECVNEFIKIMDLEEKKFHLVGGSMGGHIAGVYATLYPEKLLSLCMVCPHGINHEHHEKMAAQAVQEQKSMLLPQTKEELRAMFTWLTHKQVNFPDIILSGILQIRLEKNDYYKKLGEVLIQDDNKNVLERNLHKIKTPLLLIWGKNDNVLHPDCVEVIKEKMSEPPKKVALFEDVGHGVFLERPRKFIFTLLDFLNSLE